MYDVIRERHFYRESRDFFVSQVMDDTSPTLTFNGHLYPLCGHALPFTIEVLKDAREIVIGNTYPNTGQVCSSFKKSFKKMINDSVSQPFRSGGAPDNKNG